MQNEFLKLDSVLGDTKLLPQRKKIENPHPLLQTTVEPSKPEQREMLLDALLEISDSDPLLRYYVDSTTHEIILSFLGKVQMEVISALLQEKYHVEIEIKEPTVIYMERPLKKSRVYHSHRSSTESFLGFHWSICSTASIRERSTV